MRRSLNSVRAWRGLDRNGLKVGTMQYQIRYADSVVKQLRKMSPEVARRICGKIDRLGNDLAGDVKHLTNYSPEYRLRVGDWRILFNIVEGDTISIERINHRSDAY